MMKDRKTRILVAMDTSNFEYMCVFVALSRWEKYHSDEASAVLAEDHWHTDQENLPDLLNYDSFRKTIRLAVQDKLEGFRNILKRNHEFELDTASGIDVLFVVDDKLDNNFRKVIYPGYKAQRKAMRQRFNVSKAKAYIHNVVFKELDIEETMGYHIVKVDKCESDDVIAILMKNYTDYMLRVIISSDRDYLQIDDVVQYDQWGNKVERKLDENITDEILSRNDYLLFKIIFGDQSDNIPHVFDKCGKVKSYRLVKDKQRLRTLLKENNAAYERFSMNMSLIDFKYIPKENEERIMKVLDEKLSKENPAEESFDINECMIV